MGNVLSTDKQQQVQALGRLGWSLRRIEEATGVRRETASAYLKAAGIAVRGPGRWGHAPAKPAIEVITGPEAKPAIEVITGSEPRPPSRSPSTSACEIHRDVIELAVERGRNAMAIYQDLVSDYGFRGRYPSVMRFVRKLRGPGQPHEAHVPIETEPGQEGQVDYGEGPMVRSTETGKYRRTRLFVLTLAHSRKAVRLLVWRSSSRAWAELHEQAFRRLGGVPRVIVLDNLREGVLRPDVYDPTINPLFADVLKHYGAVALPCRVGDPDRKGKVESAIGHTQRTPLKGQRFETIEEAQAYLDRWDEQWADKRIHGRTKRQVSAMYAEEKPTLLPLPVEPFRYYQYGERAVHLDGHVEIDGAYYAAPPGYIGQKLPVQWDGQIVRLMDPHTKQLMREYRRQERGRYRTAPEYRPRRTPATTLQLLSMAAHAGKHVGALCAAIHRDMGEVGVKRILGVRSLIKKYGASAVDDACAAALEMGVPEYRFVRRYLERKPQPQIALRQIDPLIRELTLYRDHINHITKETR
ncbi:MAG: IS21 family transposase [Deltaproteobacteria bacterium]|nr:IS21 family transposase [Deltaproteobacteria bacterium]